MAALSHSRCSRGRQAYWAGYESFVLGRSLAVGRGGQSRSSGYDDLKNVVPLEEAIMSDKRSQEY